MSDMQPHELCPLCDEDRACKFHRATSPKELADALATAVKKSAAQGFIQFLEAAFAGVDEQIPAAVRAQLGRVGVTTLQKQLDDAVMGSEQLDSDALRHIAAVSFALSIAIDAREEDDDGEDLS